MKTVRIKDNVVVEVIPLYALPVEKWYGHEFAIQCKEAPDCVEQNWIYDPETLEFSAPVLYQPPAQLREEAYNTQAIIEYGGEMLTVVKATQLWQYYTAEGDNDKIQELVNLITKAKIAIWKQYPDVEGKINETISNDKIASNIYTGTGLYGEANPNSIHPNIQAKVLMIFQNDQILLTLSRTEAIEEPFTWFASSAKEQCNENGIIYNWIAIS